jgi:SAM-dependent methyltransferase
MTARSGLWHTGERVRAEPHNTLYLEHLSAYQLARQLARIGTVLDIGCGAGYGASHLAQDGLQVLGIDYELAVALEAARCYRRKGLSFVCMDGMRLGIQSASVDLVTCFQVLEHMSNPETLIREIVRVLRPTGMALFSTPNALTHLGHRNPFHHHEFTPRELETLLGRHFPFITLAGQRRPPEVYVLEASCERVRRWDLLGIRRLAPRALISLAVYAIARWRKLTPPQQMPLDRFVISSKTDDAYSLFALCGHASLPAEGLTLLHGN